MEMTNLPNKVVIFYLSGEITA